MCVIPLSGSSPPCANYSDILSVWRNGRELCSSQPPAGRFQQLLLRWIAVVVKSVDLAYNRLHNAIRTARMCRVRTRKERRKGSGYWVWLSLCSE
jgi:hypothetical protein